ncbi:MAG TPA: Asp-tRNA(Asn)/Glu-tRNA(Gln) amidotransferase subunit GatB [Patescibacteria group bacterium]|nr:Asp-tRNA(Asn)/Glu-tRNA(Gln) amidotransferase subunit GatB [Patescibacteria group bacterium]
MKYIPIIGLEVHVELKTQSKMFCGCSANYFGQQPNTHTCPVCLGLPGALPVPNIKAIDWCVMIALALNCNISKFSKFDRKNYFYPDLAKGFQTSQYDLPFGEKGWIELKNGKKIGITRVHMEEDTAKLVHEFGNSKSQNPNSNGVSLIDFNRSGVPLVEIVTEPDFHNATDVKEYLQKLQTIVQYLDVSNADMEKGNMRLEPNISLSTDGKTLPKYKVEVKNINSFKFVEKAINFELERQEQLLNSGKTPLQETRGWNETKNATVSQRIKEEANDYRYFPEPDIPPITLTQEHISTLKSLVPEMQEAKISRFMKLFSLSNYDAEILTREKSLADYFEEAVEIGQDFKVNPKQIANMIINQKINIEKILPAELVRNLVSTSQIIEIDQTELDNTIEKIISDNQKAVEDYKNGKETVIMFLVGQVMRQVGKKIDAQLVREQIKKKLLK